MLFNYVVVKYFSAVKIAVQNYTYFLNIQNFPRIFSIKHINSTIFVNQIITKKYTNERYDY